VTAGEELWVKIIELDTARRRISLSVKQAAEGGEVSEEYREAFGSHAYDTEGNYIGGIEYGEFTPETEAQAAWAEYATETVAKPEESSGADDVETPVAGDQASAGEVAVEAPVVSDEASAGEVAVEAPDEEVTPTSAD
jgi:small subunit ribosomal protein S1